MMKHFSLPSLLVVALCFALPPADVAAQQPDSTEGYLQSVRSLHRTADAASGAVGVLLAGEWVKLYRVHSLVYRAYRGTEEDAAGYVFYPVVSITPPTIPSAIPQLSAREAQMLPGTQPAASADDGLQVASRFVRNAVKVRQRPTVVSPVTVKLAKGAKVLAAPGTTDWLLVFSPNERLFSVERALGYVHESLLARSPIGDRRTGPTVDMLEDNGRGDLASSRPPVNVNMADTSRLDSLPDISTVIARRIMNYRRQNGPFEKIDDLRRVRGISRDTVEKVRPFTRVK